jgi:hypothetical protein
MKKNMSGLDGIIRVIIAITVTVLYFMNIIEGTLGIVLLVASGIFVLTAFMNFCPIYAIFGIKTCKVN